MDSDLVKMWAGAALRHGATVAGGWLFFYGERRRRATDPPDVN